MKSFLLGALCATALLAIGLALYLGLGFLEVAADVKPSGWEAGLMTSAMHAAVRRQAPAIENPLPASDATLVAGGKLYLDDCVGCHGAPGQPPSEFGATFFPPAPQFPRVGSQVSDAQRWWIAKHGIRMSGMNPQAPPYSDSELWSLAAFIGRIRDLPPAVAQAIQPPAAK